MTGTAATEVAEFQNIYELTVSVVPPNKSTQRDNNPDVVFRVESGKWNAVITEIKRMHKSGRPVLVGTTSVERSEDLSSGLIEAGIVHQVRLHMLCCSRPSSYLQSTTNLILIQSKGGMIIPNGFPRSIFVQPILCEGWRVLRVFSVDIQQYSQFMLEF